MSAKTDNKPTDTKPTDTKPTATTDKPADSTPMDNDAQKQIADLKTELENLKKQVATAPKGDAAAPGQDAPASGPVVSTGPPGYEGADWNDGPNFQGGKQSYSMAKDAVTKAMEMKRAGDDRSFGMIISHLSMEQRRIVGVQAQADPSGGYDSYDLIENCYQQAKALKELGDDRNFSLIFNALSMNARRQGNFRNKEKAWKKTT